MKHRFAAAGVLMFALMPAGCDDAAETDAGPATLEGEWAGEGEFRTRGRGLAVQAQLELNADGSYRYLILKPGILAMASGEEGTWARAGDTLTLTPAAADAGGDGDADGRTAPLREGETVFDRLEATSPTRPPKTLAVTADGRTLELRDGKMSLDFAKK